MGLVRVAVGKAMLRGVIRASLEERLEDRVRLLEVVVHDVDEVVGVHDVVDQLA